MKVDKISTSRLPDSKAANLPGIAEGNDIRFSNDDLLNAVFSGGYYIMLSDEELLRAPSTPNTPRAKKKRTRKSEEMLELSNLTLQIMENVRTLAASPAEETDTKSGMPRHEKLLQDLQSLIVKSNLVQNDHQQHLKHELDVARQQILRGGAIDDYALMQTLQEIAEVQGLSMVGSSMGGKFAAETIDAPEPAKADDSSAQDPYSSFVTIRPSRAHHHTCDSQYGSLENDVEEFRHLHSDQFSAYDISEVGGCRHKKSPFFAKKIMDSLVSITPKEQEQAAAEIVP